MTAQILYFEDALINKHANEFLRIRKLQGNSPAVRYLDSTQEHLKKEIIKKIREKTGVETT